MPSSDIEDTVIGYLKKFDLIAEKIEETEEKTPDFIVRGKDNVLIELKEKFDAQTVHEEQKSTLESGEVYQRTHTTGYWRTISNVIEKGIKQLAAQKSNTNSKYCFLFVVTSGVNPSTQVKQFESTFYGRKSIIDVDSASNEAKWCYYFSESLFLRNKNIIDGAFVINGSTGIARLLINDQSPQYDCLKKSEFVAKFVNKISIVDPLELEASESILIADTKIPRRNEEAIKQYVFDKYSINRGMVLDIPQTVFQASLDF
ncbi:hypothetical protein [Psychrobium sp. 1_MG-2023]|uniref:hypothetical protein n=1 Tax=Psychrobium sp. 1_MG-2023 TaxID=3062624 RepID=UPI0027332BAA|nr:hypothetical protein [Psychrobium sp. 1_MG-2023]MDP2562946.1 hypothetical protein [Psychrobium sp. 1_MG-2023]